MAVEKNLAAWSLQNAVSFYRSERGRVADLYPSEASMLLLVIPHVRSVLDVGCAVGNMYTMFQELDQRIAYTGVDAADGMIAEARRRHPTVPFHVGDGKALPFADDTFDLVFCTGVLNHNPDYLDVIAEMLRVSRRFLVVDLPRLVPQPYVFDASTSYIVLKHRFAEGGDELSTEVTKVPYVLAEVRQAFGGMLERLGGQLSGLACHGYYGTTHPSVTLPVSSVIFTVALLVKGPPPLRHHLRLPDDALALAEGVLATYGGRKAASVDVVVQGSGG